MAAKQIVLDFLKSDALINSEELKKFIHPDLTLNWINSDGTTILDYQSMIVLVNNFSRAYVSLNTTVNQILEEKDKVSVQFTLSVETIENTSEEMLLGYFMTIWEIKDKKLFRGFQISQKA